METEWWERIMFGALIVLGLFLAALIGVSVYFSTTGGDTYLQHKRVHGVDCIVTRDRLDNSIEQISCPPVQR